MDAKISGNTSKSDYWEVTYAEGSVLRYKYEEKYVEDLSRCRKSKLQRVGWGVGEKRLLSGFRWKDFNKLIKSDITLAKTRKRVRLRADCHRNAPLPIQKILLGAIFHETC